MGTRNLTVVIKNKEIKVAQYGQFDGHIDSTGTHILNFLKTHSLEKFSEKINKIRFFTKEEKEVFLEDSKVLTPKDFNQKYPFADRRFGSEILDLIYDNNLDITVLENKFMFAADGLMCEYGYVIDLDNNKFEIYEGFNMDPLDESERFYCLTEYDNNTQYTPIKFLCSFNLDNLPFEEDFIRIAEESSIMYELDEDEDDEDDDKAIGTTGEIVDLFNEKLTQEEWNALCIIHRLSLRLDAGIRFDWSHSIDVKTKKHSQIIDESVFLNKEKK